MRLLDASGALSNVGLVQIRTGKSDALEFGSVCGMNLVLFHLYFAGSSDLSRSLSVSLSLFLSLSLFRLWRGWQAAADVVCAQLGYDFGTVSTSSCGNYGGSNLCGAAGSPVAMASLACAGGELDIQDCSFSAPDASCLEHGSDSVVFCGSSGGGAGSIQDGSMRLLAADGSPSIDGTGRLEIYVGRAWGSVCVSGFTAGAANVACKAMGFSGAQSSDGASPCRRAGGCGSAAPQIGEVACAGQEVDLLACPHAGVDDVFCAPEESVLLRCVGVGDTQGRPQKDASPTAGLAA